MFSERLFEDILVKYPELIEGKLKFIGRQEKHFGKRIDILFEDRFNEKLIIELKKDNLDRNALSQVMEYEGYILSEKDPSARVMIIANRIPLNLKKAMDHHGIEYKEITHRQILEFLEKKDPQLFKLITSPPPPPPQFKISKTIPKSNKTTMAGKLDDILHAGGTWDELIAKAETESKKMHFRMKYSKGVLNAHIRYRTITQKNPNYLKDNIITEKGIFSKNQTNDTFYKRIIGTVTNVKAKKDAKDRFEIWFNRSSEDSFPYGITSNSDGIKIKVKINDKIFPIGFHNTKTCIWLSARLDRDGYNLTDLLKSYGIENREKLILTPLGNDTYQISRLNDSAVSIALTNNGISKKHSRRGKIIELINQGKSDQEILDVIDKEFPYGVFSTSNKQALYGTKKDLGL
ncbi:MAG: endonuclease NucS [Bacteroidales bacterium]|nr:endonuclease NucS [Bacteroidales bacterium]